MTVIRGTSHITAFAAREGSVAAVVVKAMTEQLAEKPFDQIADPYRWGRLARVSYDGKPISMAIFARMPPVVSMRSVLAASRIAQQSEVIEVSAGPVKGAVEWAEQDIVLADGINEARKIQGLAQKVIHNYLYLGWGWQSVAGPTAKQAGEVTYYPYPWGGTLSDLPNDLKHLAGRGGHVVHYLLKDTGRIVESPSQIVGLKPNLVMNLVAGVNQPVVTYGSTGLVNVFEMLQAIKGGDLLGLPVVFDSLDAAFDMQYYWLRSLQPSFQMLGNNVSLAALGLQPTDKYTTRPDPELIAETFSNLGMTVTEVAVEAALDHPTVADWYRRASAQVAQMAMHAWGLEVDLRLIQSEALLEFSPIWLSNVQTVAWEMDQKSMHALGVINTPGGTLLRSDSGCLPDITFATAVSRGYWPSGAVVYQDIYRLGMHGGVVVMVKDSEAGNVHLQARPFLTDPNSGLYLLPMGLFRMCAEGQGENDHIDPWVLLELLNRWGTAKSKQIWQQIWEAMDVPLPRNHVGRKTIARLSLDGLNLTVQGR